MAPESNSASDQMERAPSNTSYNGNDEPSKLSHLYLEEFTLVVFSIFVN